MEVCFLENKNLINNAVQSEIKIINEIMHKKITKTKFV